MTMLVEKTNMMVSNVNPRKEGQGDGMTLASDLKVNFEVPRAFMDKLVPDQNGKFSDQFYTEHGDVRLQQLYPINVHQKFEDMRVGIYFGRQATNFMPASVKGISLDPQPGGYVSVSATLQVHPTIAESGKLDALTKEVVPIEIEPLTGDLEDAGTDPADE